MMLQQDSPQDYVIGTGEDRSVRDFLEATFGLVGLDWEPYVEVDPRYLRPTDVELLRADAGKARAELGWEPEFSFEDLVDDMVVADFAEVGLTLEEARSRASAP